jgi:hypothetical protein
VRHGGRHHADVSRRLTVWLVTLPLAVAGTQLAHAIAYRLAVPEANERAHELSATGHGYMAYLPLALAIGAVLVTYAFVSEVLRLTRSTKRIAMGPQAWHFAIVAPALFACQEHFERLFHGGAFPGDTALDASFIVGLLLQLPFALAAYGLSRLLLQAARTFGDRLARRRHRRLSSAKTNWPSEGFITPRLAALALGYGSRGPPLASR